MTQRNNSFDLLRLILATFVLISHSFFLKGFNYKDIELFINKQTNLGQIAVFGFFSLSGYLVTKSYLQRKDAVQFIINRILRLFPAFWGCLMLTAFLFAPLLYFHDHHELKGYPLTGQEGAFSYITQNIFLKIKQANIDKVLENTSFRNLNGSLWTLFYEFKYYFLTFLLGISGLLKKRKALLFLYGVSYLIYLLSFQYQFTLKFPFAGHFNMLLISYLTGVVFFVFEFFFNTYSRIICFSVTGLLIISGFTGKLILILPFAFGVLCLLIFGSFKIHVKTDFSYGVYLYAFPVQLVLLLYSNNLVLINYIILSFVLTVIFAYLSSRFIEMPALQLKAPLSVKAIAIYNKLLKKTENL